MHSLVVLMIVGGLCCFKSAIHASHARSHTRALGRMPTCAHAPCFRHACASAQRLVQHAPVLPARYGRSAAHGSASCCPCFTHAVPHTRYNDSPRTRGRVVPAQPQRKACATCTLPCVPRARCVARHVRVACRMPLRAAGGGRPARAGLARAARGTSAAALGLAGPAGSVRGATSAFFGSAHPPIREHRRAVPPVRE
jgi:hypothetical protein